MIRIKKAKPDKSDNLNLALFQPKTTWVAPSSFPDLSGAKLISGDAETKDPLLSSKGPGFLTRGDALVAGFSLAAGDRAWYFPMNHLGGGNLNPDAVKEYLKDVYKLQCPKVFANAPYDLEALDSLGVDVKGKIYDVQINEALLNEERDDGYDLNTLCRLHLSTNKDESLLKEAASAYNVHPKGGLWKLPAKYVGAYAEYDALATLQIFHKQVEAMEKEDLMQVFDLETRLIPVLWAMRKQGVPIDLEAAHKLSTRLKSKEMELRHILFKEHGRFINDQSGPELAKICDKLKIDYPRTEAGNPSFEGDWLEAHSHPFLKQIAEIRQIAKNKNDYVDKIIECTVKGRMHIQWKQLVSDEGGARTGRLAAGNPPLQQFPSSKKKSGKPNEIGAAIRALLVPESGLQWFKGDYSQQEPRILVHYAAICKLAGAEAAAFTYRAKPDTDFYQFIVDICKIERRPAKTIYLSITYYMGIKEFARRMSVSTDAAKGMKADFNDRLPFIQLLGDKCMQLALNRGYIKTLFGRKRHFNYWEPSDAYAMRERGENTQPAEHDKALLKWPNKRLVRSKTHKALNALIQGSAADMMKAGLVKGYEEDGRIPYITVHDEVGGGVDGPEDGARWKKTMETCVDLCLPILMDTHIGKHWK